MTKNIATGVDGIQMENFVNEGYYSEQFPEELQKLNVKLKHHLDAGGDPDDFKGIEKLWSYRAELQLPIQEKADLEFFKWLKENDNRHK